MQQPREAAPTGYARQDEPDANEGGEPEERLLRAEAERHAYQHERARSDLHLTLQLDGLAMIHLDWLPRGLPSLDAAVEQEDRTVGRCLKPGRVRGAPRYTRWDRP